MPLCGFQLSETRLTPGPSIDIENVIDDTISIAIMVGSLDEKNTEEVPPTQLAVEVSYPFRESPIVILLPALLLT